ncbi:MAG: histidine kinase, partial [Leptospiraceae bacterium]|nr:histidine kinase [Leptospiraceae bacterium]
MLFVILSSLVGIQCSADITSIQKIEIGNLSMIAPSGTKEKRNSSETPSDSSQTEAWPSAPPSDSSYSEGVDSKSDDRTLVIPNNISSALNLKGQQVCVQLHARLTAKQDPESVSYALDAGRLSDVSRIYINDTLIGGRGHLQPYKPGAFRPQLLTIPASAMQKGANSIRIHLCNYGDYYPIQVMDPIRFGPAEAIWQQRTLREIVAFSFLAFYLMAAVQHLWLGLRRRKERYHLPFSGFLLVVSAYWFVAETFSRDLLFGDAVLWHRKLEYTLLFFIVPLFLLFLSRFGQGQGEKVARLTILVAAVLSLVSLPSEIQIVRICGWIWQIGFLAVSPYLAYLAYRQLLRPFPYARLMTLAVLLLLVSAIHDILVSLSILHSMRISSYSLAFLVLGLILLLGDQLVQATNRSEKLLSHTTRLNLEMLKKNIHPHFLANSLNSAVELVHEDPNRAEKLLLALVEEMRSTIELSEQTLCPLETEIQLCRNHVEVMSLRMEKDITLEVLGTLDTEIPPLILLTIVENGITHGFRTRKEGSFTINVRKFKDEVFIAVENDGEPPKPESSRDSHSSQRPAVGTGTRY